MYPQQPLLEFIPPQSQRSGLQVAEKIPQQQNLVLPFAHPTLTSWGAHGQNYILQQLFKNDELELCLVTITVQEYSLLKVNSSTAAGVLLYMLEGQAFMQLKGYGAVSLLEGTYTLQHFMQESHQLMVTPGTCQLLYIAADALLEQYRTEYPSLNALSQWTRPSPSGKQQVLRMHIDSSIYQLLDMFRLVTPKPDASFIRSLALKLLLHLQEQQTEANRPGNYRPEELPAMIRAFIADHLHLPVEQQMQALQKHFGLTQKELDRHFRQ